MEPSTTEVQSNPDKKEIEIDKHEIKALAIRNALKREEGDGLYEELAYETLLSGGHGPEAVKAAQAFLKNHKIRLNETLEGKRYVKLEANDFTVAKQVIDRYGNPKNLLQKVIYPFVRLGIKNMGNIVRHSSEIQGKQQNFTPSVGGLK